MRIIVLLAICLFCIKTVQAQVGSSISADGSAPNDNAMLDVQSPATGAGKGMLIPRVMEAQRTNANSLLAGGLLNDSGELRGGAAQGLIVYQTNGAQGLYFNSSSVATPAWVYLGASTTNYLPLTGGTMSGALDMGAQVVSNVAYIDFSGDGVSIGRGANGFDSGTAVGASANGTNSGAALGVMANGGRYGAAMGLWANGSTYGAALGYSANGADYGAAVGFTANGNYYGAAVGYFANGMSYGAAVGRQADGTNYGAAVGRSANGANYGVALGNLANGSSEGAVVGRQANGYNSGSVVGYAAKGTNQGAVVGRDANGSSYGAAVGQDANGSDSGAAVGGAARGNNYGVAMGLWANGTRTNVAIGAQANARGGTNHIAIGHNVTNNLGNDTAVIRGTLYLDGGTGVNYRTSFGSGNWSNKAFEIDHPLDPENKILRHFCLEGPQVWNVYAGNAQLVNGQATVQLPDYYSALNLAGSEICSLTPWGRANVWVAQGVNSNTFAIAGDADVKVSWTIKVLRNDPGCLEDLRRRPVEQWKKAIR